MGKPVGSVATVDKADEPHAAVARCPRVVLLVSAEPFVRELLAVQLRAAGCFPIAVASTEEGERVVAHLVPDLMVVDIDANPCPGMGWLLHMRHRSDGKVVPTVMLAADLVRTCGHESITCGADLCVAKPFEPRELLRQLLQLIRQLRVEVPPTRMLPPLKAAAIELDREQPTVRLLLSGRWQALDLPWTEHRVLECLFMDHERICSRESIRNAVWSDTLVDLRTVDQYVRRLRRTLGAAGAQDLVKTIKGSGYALDLAALQRLQGGSPLRAPMTGA